MPAFWGKSTQDERNFSSCFSDVGRRQQLPSWIPIHYKPHIVRKRKTGVKQRCEYFQAQGIMPGWYMGSKAEGNTCV